MRALLDREHVPVDAFKDVDTTTTAPSNNDVLTWSSANGTWQPAVAPGAGGGEANTGSNQGVDGVGVYDTKVGVDLQFRNIAPASNKITVSLNGKDIDLDIADANLTPTATSINGTAWRVFYTDASGDVTELALGTSGDVLTSNGAAAAPSWQASGGGGGDVTKVGTPVNNQLGVWTGDGTIEGDLSLLFDTTLDRLTVGGGASGYLNPEIFINAQATGVPQLVFGQADVNKAFISYVDADDMFAIDSDNEIEFRPGNLGDWGIFSTTQAKFGNYTFNTDQTVGAGQDNFVLTYDQASGEISLESSGGGVTSIDDLSDVDTTTNAPVLGDTLVFDGTNWVTNLTQLIKEVDFVGTTTVYIGEAQPGTATSSAAWRVKRTVFTGDDSETLFADGNTNFDNIWNNRASLSYS